MLAYVTHRQIWLWWAQGFRFGPVLPASQCLVSKADSCGYFAIVKILNYRTWLLWESFCHRSFSPKRHCWWLEPMMSLLLFKIFGRYENLPSRIRNCQWWGDFLWRVLKEKIGETVPLSSSNMFTQILQHTWAGDREGVCLLCWWALLRSSAPERWSTNTQRPCLRMNKSKKDTSLHWILIVGLKW